MTSGSLARRYARALMDIGGANNTYEKLGRELRDLARAMRSSEELTETLTNPAIARAERRKVLEAVAVRVGASKIIIHFAFLLLDRERTSALPDISRELDVMIDEKLGRITADVTSATALTPTQEGQIKKVLEQLSGRSVQLQKHEDPEILGGVIAKVGDDLYDGSLRSQLEHMRGSLAK